MTIKLIVILSLFFASFPLCAQWQNREEGKLQGNVKELRLNHLKIRSNGDSLWGEVAKDNDPFWFKGYVDESYLFDKDGKTREYHTYYTDDADDNKTKNIFTKNGRLSEQQYFADDRRNGRMKYHYDSKGRVTQIIRYDTKGRVADRIFHLHNPQGALPLRQSKNNIWVHLYDWKGRCTEEKCLKPNGRINFRHVYFYDPEGRQTKLIIFDGRNRQQATRHFEYDEKGRVCSIRYVSSISCTITNYWFDENGNEIRCQITNVDLQKLGNTKAVKEFHSAKEIQNRYVYDQNGNWTERYLFIDGVPQYMQSRELIYWDE